MPNPILIPAIDLIDGKVVRLTQGDYLKQTHYPIDPIDMALKIEALGGTHLHIIDLDGAKKGASVNLKTIERIIKHTHLTVQIGGGIRTLSSVKRVINSGVQHVIIGSILIKAPQEAKSIIAEFPNKIIGGLDIRDGKIAIEGWREESAFTVETFLSEYNDLPLHQIIVTDIQRDGTLSGPNIDLLQSIGQLCQHSLGAAGGISTKQDIEEIKTKCSSVSSCIIGKSLYEGSLTLENLFNIK